MPSAGKKLSGKSLRRQRVKSAIAMISNAMPDKSPEAMMIFAVFSQAVFDTYCPDSNVTKADKFTASLYMYGSRLGQDWAGELKSYAASKSPTKSQHIEMLGLDVEWVDDVLAGITA